MKTFLAALVFVGLAVILLGVNIFFLRKPFPNGEISTNPEMQKRGIKCAKQEELEMLAAQKKLCDGKFSDACLTCKLYTPSSSGLSSPSSSGLSLPSSSGLSRGSKTD